MRRALAGAMLLASMTHLFGAAGEFWQKKDYHTWTRQECRKLLEKSPWSQHYDIAELVFATVNQETEPTSGRASSLQVNYVVQFRSALPVRQAVVRSAMLNAKVDAAQEESRKQMEAQAESFLAVQFPDVVVVHVLYGSNTANDDHALANYWQHQTLETLKNSFYLISARGLRVPPIHYEAAAGAAREFEVTFPRAPQGAPLVSAGDKVLALEFMHPDVGPRGATRVYLPFRLQDMKIAGKLVY